jgi:hypothetical protein
VNLQSTKSLLDILKTTTVEINLSEYSDIENYHCNVLKFGRDNCVLITNNKTLFSFFLYGIKATDFKHFEEVISESIFKILVDIGFPQYQFEKVLDSLQTIQYAKTSDKSVLSSMNDMKQHIKGCLLRGDTILEINQKINKIPYKRNGYKSSVELFGELLS